MDKPVSNGIKVAVIGSGPASLTCAGDLAKRGYEATIFEALHTPGRRVGIRHSGIPSAQKLVRQEIAKIEALGATIDCNVVAGRSSMKN
ncbi:MAG: NAD(P)-binding protein [Christensenellales bacterium]